MTRYFYVDGKYEFTNVLWNKKKFPTHFKWLENADACMVVSPYGGMYIATFDNSVPYILPVNGSDVNDEVVECNFVFDKTYDISSLSPCEELEDVKFAAKIGLYYAYKGKDFPHGYTANEEAWAKM